MVQKKKKIVVSVTGASGSIYAKVLLDKLMLLSDQVQDVAVVMSDNAKDVWKFELQNESYKDYPFTFYSKNDFMAPFASGSANYEAMIVVPASMGTLARIAHGVSSDLTTRAADVILKERRKLIMVTRETPLSTIHINNMQLVTQAGGIICPASPSFYSLPQSFEDLAATVVDRVLSLCDIHVDSFKWGE
ncbi:UbiX family flavin prenyltransferase [Sphingobacterium psychroaquaticum]|uniref:Flavin prenyltransferase UbiX n=1 Tax=Sphingobacterium psychroaquaticum TaxID=561061 RepID=A0A1X7IFZ9_9SPHI|nr:UbiX family flavin prenyltransferase [Sphingobacterium psychroaquaticum]QBQ41609.1 UbiX family flavin prenyltransferase [Sphingobacterium psychroaquaticum]SMG13279.1 4-hydroxy-3-polyprenylbenzoate decarboxylase [Sphingobacterium psychroaquaticum]